MLTNDGYFVTSKSSNEYDKKKPALYWLWTDLVGFTRLFLKSKSQNLESQFQELNKEENHNTDSLVKPETEVTSNYMKLINSAWAKNDTDIPVQQNFFLEEVIPVSDKSHVIESKGPSTFINALNQMKASEDIFFTGRPMRATLSTGESLIPSSPSASGTGTSRKNIEYMMTWGCLAVFSTYVVYSLERRRFSRVWKSLSNLVQKRKYLKQ